MKLSQILPLLSKHRFHFQSELELQYGVEQLLKTARIKYSREHSLSSHDRIDFLVGSLGIEIKVGGSMTELLRQVHRYLEYPEIQEMLIITSRIKHAGLPKEINGKRVVVYHLLELPF